MYTAPKMAASDYGFNRPMPTEPPGKTLQPTRTSRSRLNSIIMSNMKRFICIAIAITIISFGSLNAKEKDIQSRPSDPFINMLKAVETSDIEKFKRSYAKDVREDEDQNDWKKNISEARANIRKIFGDVKYDDFTFKFDEDKSKLGIIHKGKLVFWIGISKEDGLWKLNER